MKASGVISYTALGHEPLDSTSLWTCLNLPNYNAPISGRGFNFLTAATSLLPCVRINDDDDEYFRNGTSEHKRLFRAVEGRSHEVI